MTQKKMFQPSEIKSEIARTKPRVGGRFVASPDKQQTKKKLEEEHIEVKEKLTELEQRFVEEGRMSDEDRAYIGNDSLRFFERALEKAQTWYEAYKFAKELRPLQHPAYASVQPQDQVTQRKELIFELRAPIEHERKEETIGLVGD